MSITADDDGTRGAKTESAKCDPAAWEFFKKHYLRRERPAFAHSYEQLKRVAALENWTIPSSSTLRRWINALDDGTRAAKTSLGFNIIDAARAHAYERREHLKAMKAQVDAIGIDGRRDAGGEWIMGGRENRYRFKFIPKNSGISADASGDSAEVTP